MQGVDAGFKDFITKLLKDASEGTGQERTSSKKESKPIIPNISDLANEIVRTFKI